MILNIFVNEKIKFERTKLQKKTNKIFIFSKKNKIVSNKGVKN